MRTDDLYLVDMVEAAQAIESFVGQETVDRFVRDAVTCSAVLWKLMIVGEAATKLSAETKALFTDIPWDQIRGLRNRMVHGYFTLDWSTLWDLVTTAIPALREQAERALAAQFPETYRRLQERRADGS